jgi:hypothetical protein
VLRDKKCIFDRVDESTVILHESNEAHLCYIQSYSSFLLTSLEYVWIILDLIKRLKNVQRLSRKL